jgi:hypothetical protein
MLQQGQVVKLKTKGADGKPLWAYRYRFQGRGSGRRQVGDSRLGRRRYARFARRSTG